MASTSTWGGGTACPPRASLGEAPPTDAGDQQKGDPSSPAIEASPRRRQTRPSLAKRKATLRATMGVTPLTAGRRGTRWRKKHLDDLAVLEAALQLNVLEYHRQEAIRAAAGDDSAMQPRPRRQRSRPQVPPAPK